MDYIRFLELDELKFRYFDIGKGDVLILLHGFCESMEIFENLVPELASHYRVIGIDLPGHGGSELIPGAHSLEQIAEWLHKVISKLSPEVEKFVLVGHSLGGYITLAYADQFPEKLRGIGLFHSTAAPDSNRRQSQRNKALNFIEKHGASAFIEPFVKTLFYQPRPEWLKRLYEISSKTTQEGMLAMTEAMRDRRDQRKLLESLKVPVLFITGRHDDFIPLRHARDQFMITGNVVTYVLENVGHMGMYESPKQCTLALRSFMKYAALNE